MYDKLYGVSKSNNIIWMSDCAIVTTADKASKQASKQTVPMLVSTFWSHRLASCSLWLYFVTLPRLVY